LFCHAFSPVAADPASAFDISLITQQFVNALITPSVVPVFAPNAVLNVTFSSVGTIETGQALTEAQVSTEPSLVIVGTTADFASGGDLNSNTKYTMMMIDGDVAGSTNPNGVNTHYLQNDLVFGNVTSDDLTLTGTTTPVITYAGPGPASGSGPHRYILLLYPQPTNFTAPATPAAGSSVTMIDFPTYLKDANLGNPIAGNYFTVEVDTSTVSVSPTSAVNTASLTYSSSSAASSSSTKSAASASATAKKSSALAVGHNGVGAGVFALAVAAFFA